MIGYVYILRCNDASYYTGSTKNIELRLAQHQQGMGAKHTKKRLPVELVFVEQFERIDEAYAREKQIQGWSRKKKEALIQGDFNQLHKLACCQNDSHFSGFDSAGFDSAQPPGRSLSEVEGDPQTRSLSEVENRSLSEVENRCLSEVENRCLSGVEGKTHSPSVPQTRSLSGVEGEGEGEGNE